MIKKLAAPIKILLILTGLIFLSYLLVNYNKPHFDEPFFFGSNNLRQDTQAQEDKIKEEKNTKINSIINSNLSGQEGQYAIYIKNLKNSQIIEYNSNVTIGSASIYKLAIMYKTFDALEKGEIAKNDLLGRNQKLTSGQSSRTVGEALRLMITISDNDSAFLLAESFGWANIENFLANIGIKDFLLATKTEVTAASTAQILERIYTRQAVSQAASQEMKKLLLSQTVNDRIPKYLPKNIKVAHKTGELDTIRNDAGIVYGKKSDYIFVFLTDTPDPENAAEKIAHLSEDIFNILEQN